MKFTIVMFVALGGAAGAVGRYLCSLGIHQLFGFGFPLGTLIVNVSGSFAIGLLYVVVVESQAALAHYRAPLMIGFLGAFTTFSAFSLETMHLLEGGEIAKAAMNVVLNVALCLMACWIGLGLARQF